MIMKTLKYLFLSGLAVLFACTNSGKTKKEKTDTIPAVEVPLSEATTTKEKLSEPVIKQVEINEPITIERFWDEQFQQKFDLNKFERKDEPFQNIHNSAVTDTVKNYSLANSRVKYYNHFPIGVDISDKDLFPGNFIEIGMTKDEFISLFTDFSEKTGKEGLPGPSITIEGNEILFYDSPEAYNIWTFVFSDDKLSNIKYEAYID